jgi:hypothetical protein
MPLDSEEKNNLQRLLNNIAGLNFLVLLCTYVYNDWHKGPDNPNDFQLTIYTLFTTMLASLYTKYQLYSVDSEQDIVPCLRFNARMNYMLLPLALGMGLLGLLLKHISDDTSPTQNNGLLDGPLAKFVSYLFMFFQHVPAWYFLHSYPMQQRKR